ncbi:hypothetical protein BN1048_01194 [Jeotgalicoccus saudimassiliensis]|uniref:Family 2 glycosyl transferase n=1 Tax=Jeotgalicoccus saudimassiliensis TaxID=1461582 RepID=A0A078M411_9STAP|nr:hypothetical protein [Jeotgalicoccus saudimassiliensis]CEA00995.1 hypothetical protein BN1048_01194 [Jeotgalicoccus saudimassiliensis]
MKKLLITSLCAAAAIAGVFALMNVFADDTKEAYEMQPARIHDGKIEINSKEGFEPMIVKGVNMGMAKPGYFPGEAAITEDEYFRWFEHIGRMNANTVRVYTLHPPGFYSALKDYNEKHPAKPIYIMHGFWVDEVKMHEDLDAYEKKLNKEFDEDIKSIINAVHGNANIAETSGKAHGKYKDDVSEYVISWILGVEWYPPLVVNTNEVHHDAGQFDGTYYSTKDASPFERWLAEKMEFATRLEHENYGSLRPMSFTNWVTTDLLEHESDSSDMEDMVTVNPNVIYTEGPMTEIGQFASYHIYPYYPDFLNYEKEYVEHVDHRGEKNNYAGYLKKLHKEHTMPLLVAEFGVPASRGMTHKNPYGWNQGFLSEKEQGEIVTHLFEDIMHEEMMGGLVFTWQDEWFKRTWNTMDYDNPDRRPYWSNAQTNEQQFGLLSFDTHKIGVDGSTDDWQTDLMYEGNDELKSLSMDTDERYLYFKIEHEPGFNGEIDIPLDIIPGQGNTAVNGVYTENAVDFIIQLREDESRVVVDDYYDFFNIQYGHTLGMINPGKELEKNSGRFNSIRFALNKELYLPDRDELIPFESYETGLLKEGNGNPEHEDYNSLNDYYWDRENGVIEIRIPWMLISAKDPSQHEFIGNIAENGLEAEITQDSIKAGVIMKNRDVTVDSFPQIFGGKLSEMKEFTWEKWDLPASKERVKKSYDILKETFSKY